MLRKTLTILSLIGLLLSVGLWGVSYIIPYRTVAQGGILADSIDLSDGQISRTDYSADFLKMLNDANTHYEVPRRMVPYEPIGSLMVTPKAPKTPDTKTQLIGSLKQATIYFYDAGSVRFVRVRLWMPPVAFAAVLWACSPVAHHRRRKRKKLGLCVKCGYDLRGSKDRCPECGTDFDTAKNA